MIFIKWTNNKEALFQAFPLGLYSWQMCTRIC